MNQSAMIADNLANDLLPSANPQTSSTFFEATGSTFLKPPALLGVNLRAGPVGSVWGLAPGRQGV
jgi:hypothetical protein